MHKYCPLIALSPTSAKPDLLLNFLMLWRFI